MKNKNLKMKMSKNENKRQKWDPLQYILYTPRSTERNLRPQVLTVFVPHEFLLLVFSVNWEVLIVIILINYW